ncbi:MAG: hypothetical protein IPN36_11315 [Bacteroidetes bacterium]|nr:hypothetical protein [Bacteroidota bacterium]
MKKYLLSAVLVLVGAGMLGYQNFFSGSIDDLEIKIENTPVIMPACYKVYGNEEALDGRYFLFKMMLTNNGSRPIKNVKATYEIPKFVDQTELGKVSVINPGQSIVIACYPAFKDNIIEKTTSSKEKAKITISSSGGDQEQEFGFEMKGRNEFLYTCINPEEIRSYSDVYDNNDLLACYVTPEDPIIKYYTQQLQEKVLKGETASVTNDPKEAVRFLLGVYQGTYLSHMVYSGTSGVPSRFDDLQSMVQSLRLPREVVTGNTGLCIELSLFYASVLMAAGLEPIIYLIPGHAYPGIKVNGQYFAIEATCIGGEGMGGREDAETAFKKGMKSLDDFIKAAQMGDERYSIVNVRELIAQQVTPMELKDDQFLRQKVEKIADGWAGGALPSGAGGNMVAVSNQESGNSGGGNDGGGGGGGNSGGGSASGMATYTGAISFNYPSHWSRVNRPFPNLPQVITAMVPPDQMATIQVYQIPGASNADEALQIIQQQLYASGQEVQYQQAGSRGSYQVFNGVTNSMNGSLQWQAFLKRGSGGVVGVIMGTAEGAENYNGVLNQVKSSIK